MNAATTPQAVGSNIMVWGLFSWHCNDPFIRVEQHLKAEVYYNIIAYQVHPVILIV